MSPTNPELRQFITQFFSDEELETLCFDYFPEALNDFGGGMSKNRKAMRLIEHCENHSKLNELNTALFHERQDAYWERFHQIPDNLVDVGRYVDWLKSLPDKVYPPTIVLGPPPKPEIRIHEKTGIELIRIPTGPFLYGDEKQVMELPEYWIGRYPVTNSQFTRFIRASNYKTTAEQKGFGRDWTDKEWVNVKGADWRHPVGPKSSIDGKNDHPVVQISWNDAFAFCDWAGLALPSEEEWEKAARGTDGRLWPWGNEEPTAAHCNFNNNAGTTTPAGKYSPKGDSPYGCADMAGNVWEWTESWYDEAQARRVVRGGSWNDDQDDARAAYRNDLHPFNRNDNVGCRVVRRHPSPAL